MLKIWLSIIMLAIKIGRVKVLEIGLEKLVLEPQLVKISLIIKI